MISGYHYLLAAVLLVSGAAQAQNLAYLGLSDGYWEVWISDNNGKSPRQLTRLGADVSKISWYSEADALFVNMHDSRWYRLTISNSKLEKIDPPFAGIIDAVIAPDGQHVTYSFSAAGSSDANNIWTFNLADRSANKLTSMPKLQHEPSWSPDGRYVYFLSAEEGGQAHDIWRVGSESKNLEKLTVGQVYHFDVAVRDDGAYAYSNNQTGNYELWWKPTAGNAEQLTQSPALDARPSWSAAGDQLVYESSEGGSMGIWRLDMRTRTPTRINTKAKSARHPIWAPIRQEAK